MDQTQADKVKYWRYKLNQQQKANKTANNKPKATRIKTPQKPRKDLYLSSTHDNFFSCTIDKLKTLLSDSSQRKSTQIIPVSTKHSKQITAAKPHQNGLVRKNKKPQEKNNKSISILNTKRQKNTIGQNSAKGDKSSRSKSRSKSRLYKTERLRKETGSKNEGKSSPSIKASKKKSIKTKSTTKKIQTILLPNVDDQNGSWKKQLMETLIVHQEKKSAESVDKEPDYLNHLRVWQEYEEQVSRQQNQNRQALEKYFKGFLASRQYLRTRKQKHKSRVNSKNFKQIVKSQEEKLLQLKQCLFNLKNSENLDKSLDLLIYKVNENINNLKNYESGSEPVSGNPSISKQSRRSSLNELKQDNMEKENTNKAVVDYFSQANKSSEDHLNEKCQENVSEMNYNKPLINVQEKEPQKYVDEKFQFIQIAVSKDNKPQQGIRNEAQKFQCYRQSPSHQQMLLSPSSHKVQSIKPVSKDTPFVTDFISTNQEPQKIKFEEEQEQENCQQIHSPSFMRSQPIPVEIQALNELEHQLIEPTGNKDLINSINSIIQSKINISDAINQYSVGIEQRNALNEYVFNHLMMQVAIILEDYPHLKDCLAGKFNDMTIEIFQQGNYQVDINGSEEKQSSSQQVVPISCDDDFIFLLTRQILQEAYKHNLPQRIIKPLGVSSSLTLKCMRRLTCDDEYDQEIVQFENDEEENIEEYTEILDSELFSIFEDKFSPAPDNPYQLIFNRCVYDALNFVLDDYRPFGTRGLPGLFFGSFKTNAPTLEFLQNRLTYNLTCLTSIKLGHLNKSNISGLELNKQTAESFDLWQKDITKELEKQFSYNEQDDTIERYELMLELEQRIFLEQTEKIMLLLARKINDYL